MVVLPASTPRIFLSTPSARRATAGLAGCHGRSQISIHALREEGDDSPETKTAGARDFYPRPPRGGRLQEAGKAHWCRQFLSTPSARRATPDDETRAMLKEFLSTPSARRATNKEHEGMSKWPFLSTPSARRATAKTETKSLFSYKLYNILHEFRRALIYNGSKNYPNHAK